MYAKRYATSRYVWVNFDIDTIDIAKSAFTAFEPVAKFIQLLRFEREMQSEYFYYDEVKDVQDFVNVKEIHILPLDGLRACVGATEEHLWPCGEENVFYIDPHDSTRVFRGGDGEDEIVELYPLM